MEGIDLIILIIGICMFTIVLHLKILDNRIKKIRGDKLKKNEK